MPLCWKQREKKARPMLIHTNRILLFVLFARANHKETRVDISTRSDQKANVFLICVCHLFHLSVEWVAISWINHFLNTYIFLYLQLYTFIKSNRQFYLIIYLFFQSKNNILNENS